MLKTSLPHASGSRSGKNCSLHELFLTKNHEILKSLLVSYATVSKALVFFAVSRQIPVVYLADRGRAEINLHCEGNFKSGITV